MEKPLLLSRVFTTSDPGTPDPLKILPRGRRSSDRRHCKRLACWSGLALPARGPQGEPIKLLPSLFLSVSAEQPRSWTKLQFLGRTQLCCTSEFRFLFPPKANSFMWPSYQVGWYPERFPREGNVSRALVLTETTEYLLSATWLQNRPSLGGVVLTGQSSAPGGGVRNWGKGEKDHPPSLPLWEAGQSTAPSSGLSSKSG